MPWVANHQRRTVLFRYSPANLAFGGGRHDFDRDHRAGPAWPSNWYEGLSDEQRAVLEPPYSPGEQRPILGDDGELLQESREALKQWGWDGIGNNRETCYLASHPPKPKPERRVSCNRLYSRYRGMQATYGQIWAACIYGHETHHTHGCDCIQQKTLKQCAS